MIPNSASRKRSSSLTGQSILPLLSSLSFETTKPIIHTLLQHCEAQRTIRTFFILHMLRIRKKKENLANQTNVNVNIKNTNKNKNHPETQGGDSHKKSNGTPDSQCEADSHPSHKQHKKEFATHRSVRSRAGPVPAAQHFMFRALQSESLPIRQHAFLQLFHAADNPERVGILVSVLWDIIREEMDAFLSCSGLGANADSDAGKGFGHCNADSVVMNAEGILQLYGLMTHYVTGSNEQYYPFLIEGGLDWICEKILSLIHLLMVCRSVNSDGIINGGVAAKGNMNIDDVMDVQNDEVADESEPKTPSVSKRKPTSEKEAAKPLFTFASPSILKPRHYFTAVSQSNIMVFPSQSEEEIKKRIYILVDFCLRMTVLAGDNKWKERHESVLNWLWRKQLKKDHDHNTTAAATNSTTASDIKEEKETSGDQSGRNDAKISPLGCLLAASLILKNSDCGTTATSNTAASNSLSPVLTGEDYVLMPEKRVDRINWMLARITDIHSDVMVVGKEKEKGMKDKDKKGGTRVRAGSNEGTNKRKRGDGSSLGRSDSGPASSDQANASDDPSEFLNRLIKRQRSSASNSNSTARAIMRAVGSSADRASSGNSDGLSSAAEVMARTLSIIDRGRDEGEGSRNGDLGSQALTSSLGRFMEFRMGLEDRDEENGNDDQFQNGDDAGDNGEMKNENDEDGEDDRHFHVEDDEEIESDVQMDEIDEDEEIESEDDDDDDDGDDVDDDDDDDVDDDDRDHEGQLLDNIIVEVGSNPFQDDLMMVDELENARALSSLQRPIGSSSRDRCPSDGSSPMADDTKAWRSNSYIHTGIEIMEAQHPTHHHSRHSNSREEPYTNRKHLTRMHDDAILTPSAEQMLVQSMCDIVRPPKKPLKLKVFMRRAPTQEEFFRGSLSQNPILISSLKTEQGSSASSSDNEPRVKDLRQRIANELQMGDSAELLELLVANKILDMNLKLRVIAHTVWRTHLLENTSAINSENSFRQLISGTSLSESGLLSRARFDENTPISSLPPMVVTYRLAGVDGEATEDNVAESDLVDPDAPPDTNTSSHEYEKKMEKEFGITRLITRGRGVSVLLRSVESHLGQIMTRIRRDDIGRSTLIGGKLLVRKNRSRAHFLKSPPCPSLTLLQHCAMIRDNRKKLINAQAPTVLLRLLLDVLNSIDESPRKKHSSKELVSQHAPSGDASERNDIAPISANSHTVGNNPTADALQELIENLSSDISAEMTKKSLTIMDDKFETNSDISTESDGSEESTLPMLLSSLRATSLSPPLRKVIAKLLPFLTYGQVAQSRALAAQFLSHIHVENLGGDSSLSGNQEAVLMETFVDAAVHLPPVAVCDTLRSELIRQGFVKNIIDLILFEIPSSPPPWSPALFVKGVKLSAVDRGKKEKEWKLYYNKRGLQIAFKILVGLSTEHFETQCFLSNATKQIRGKKKTPTLIAAAHWIESTSDKDDIKTNGLGILAETLLDTMLHENEQVKSKIAPLRQKIRERKKELAQERRKKALSGMSAFGRLVGDGANEKCHDGLKGSIDAKKASPRRKSLKTPSSSANKSKASEKTASVKPSWMLEMESMEDEGGLSCAVCQEGRSYKPSEMLGLYAFMKKVNIPNSKGGARGAADGALMLLSLPQSRLLPESLRDSDADIEWYQPSLDLAALLKATPYGASAIAASTSSVMGSRSSCNIITTVTASNAIHYSCHAKARTADRNHPKAPKTEWEGACLRNSRVSCNIILPLISKENSRISVMAMENALVDHQQTISNMLGSKPKSMLWVVLQDLRLLLLRMSYGEALNIDCGGGSLSSNSSLIFHLLFLANMFARDAEHDAPITVRHAKGLSTGFLAASAILRANDLFENSQIKKMRKSFADAGPMAAICCILFQNSMNEEEVLPSMNSITPTERYPPNPPPKRRWELHKDHFLTGLLQCAGRRYSLGINGSGCVSQSPGRRMRSSSFSDWNEENSSQPGRRPIGKRSGLEIEDYAKALRPMITLYATLDQLSKGFTFQMDDENIETCSQQVASVVEACQKAKDIRHLISLAKITLDDTSIVEELEAGMNTVA